MGLDMTSLDLVYELARSSNTDDLGPLVREAVEVIETTLDTHGEDHVAISFNGGKDCEDVIFLPLDRRLFEDRKGTVLLHLLSAVLYRRRKPPPVNGAASTSSPSVHQMRPIRSIYVSHDCPFPSMEAFVQQAESYYGLNLTRTSGLSMKAALEDYLAEQPDVTAVFVGTRRGDPHGANLDFMQPTDPGWPQFVRVHPVINWSYQDVWAFLRRFKIPYCDLYDKGYTSLGSTYNTFPNPALEKDGCFRPAFELTDDTLERAGRDDRKKKPQDCVENEVLV